MTTETPIRYIATTRHGSTIDGIGATPGDAIGEAQAAAGPDTEFIALRASAELIAKVEADGGAGISWHLVTTAGGYPTDTSLDWIADHDLDPDHYTAVLD